MNLPIPQPPTDNLYKFMAISGLLMLAAVVYFPFRFEMFLMDKAETTQMDIAVEKADQEFEKNKIDILSNIVSTSISIQKGTYKNSVDKFPLVYSNDEIKRLENEVFDLQHGTALGYAKIQVNDDMLQSYKKWLHIILWIQLPLMIISSQFAIRGFRLWHSRIQIYVDKAIKRGAVEKDG